MKLVVDAEIPLVAELFAANFDLVQLPTAALNASNLKDADILICRSVTKVNKQLLKNTAVSLVASPTSGIDHFDTEFLIQHNINYYAAPGSNAPAVTDYILSVMAVLLKKNILTGKRAGIIGVGHVGSRVQALLEWLGFEVWLNDPFRAEVEANFNSTPLAHFKDFDLICIHASLSHNPPYPSYHLLNKDFFKALKPGCVVLNAARGAIINSNDLLQFGSHLHYCFDVFEHEPKLDPILLQRCLIATPHIAGYTVESKQRAIRVIADKIYQYFKLPQLQIIAESVMPNLANIQELSNWHDIVLQIYNPLNETKALQQQHTPAAIAQCFNQLRLAHNQRHEFTTDYLR